MITKGPSSNDSHYELNMAAEPSEWTGAGTDPSAMAAGAAAPAAETDPGAEQTAGAEQAAPPHDPGDLKRSAEDNVRKPGKQTRIELSDQAILLKLRGLKEEHDLVQEVTENRLTELAERIKKLETERTGNDDLKHNFKKLSESVGAKCGNLEGIVK